MNSKQPRKQRKFRENAPLHIKNKFLGCNLSKELKDKYGVRSLVLRKQDKVKIQRGQFKGKEGTVDRIDVKRVKVFVSVAQTTKKDGSKVYYPLNPSNLMITNLNLSDSKRIKSDKKETGDKDGKKSQ